MSKVHHLKIPEKPNPFCSVFVDVRITLGNANVSRLRPPLGLILGLDELTVKYIVKRVKQFETLAEGDGYLLDRITWRDTMPRVCVATSDPIARGILSRLAEQPVILHDGGVPCETPKIDDMELTINQDGAYWSFTLEGTHYCSHTIPVSVFTIALERYSKR